MKKIKMGMNKNEQADRALTRSMIFNLVWLGAWLYIIFGLHYSGWWLLVPILFHSSVEDDKKEKK